RKIDIKADNAGVVFGKKLKKMSLPSRLIGNEIYIPPEILKSKEFAEIAEADTVWNPSSLLLSINRRANISTVRYFTKPESTRVLIQLEEPLSYTVSKTSGSVVIKILKGKVQRDFLSVNNGVIKDISYGMEGRFALVKISFQQTPKFVKTSMLSKPYRISVYIKHSKNIDMSSKKETVIPATEEDYVASPEILKEADLTPPEKYGEIQISEIISVIENNENNKDLEKVPVAKFEDKNIIDDSFAIIDDTEDVVPKQEKEKEPCYKCKKIIVLDAGHGGEDPGAVGPNGTKEKDINLEIVYELKTIFDNDDNYEIILTRKDDTFIPLAERTNIANECKADLFISVHCNASFDRSVNGFEIYFLSEKATDSEAVATAVLENSVLELEKNPGKKNISLQSVFWSLAITEYINECSELSGFISAETTNRLKIPNKGVKQANFYVLRGAQMPSVLVESAFISNYIQESKFSSKKFRVAVADSIYKGVVKYYASKDKKQNNK
ncbi:MAG: N-acetylmuramoyl-L-alanine amidase, partial [Endomicrobium sp.]|nr:N-acetylmuramoyl-L-alanine amidase [Endomicrobium sp.]